MAMKVVVIAALLVSTPALAQTSRRQVNYDAAASASKTGADPERVICRTAMETGSLVKRTRRCMTAREWAQRRTSENIAARDLVRDNTGLIIGQ